MATNDNKFVHSVVAIGSSHVMIPSVLLRKLFPTPPTEVVLTAVDGIPWTVFTNRHGSDLFLGHGWDTFRDIYVYGDSDIVEFTYDSNASFRVSVFGSNMIARCVSEVEEHIGIHYQEYLPITAFAADQNVVTQLVDSGILAGTVLNFNETPSIQLNRRRLIQAAARFSQTRSSVYSPPAEDFLVANNATNRSPSTDLSSGWSSNSGQNDASDIQINGTRAFSRPPGSPHCSIDVTMLSLQNGFTLQIPLVFAEAQLVRGANKRTLHAAGGGNYAVICLLKGKRAHIVSGWKEFASDHDLAPGDRCVFQQNIGSPNTWDVSFYWGPSPSFFRV